MLYISAILECQVLFMLGIDTLVQVPAWLYLNIHSEKILTLSQTYIGRRQIEDILQIKTYLVIGIISVAFEVCSGYSSFNKSSGLFQI